MQIKEKIASEIYKNTSLSILEGEIWKDILNYEGLYQVSNLGRIKSFLQGEKILKPWFGGGSNLLVTLSSDGIKKKLLISNIVGVTFIGVPNRKDKEVFVHLNKIKTDNSVSNISIEKKADSALLNYHIGVKKDWGIKHVGVNTRFVSTQIYIGTDRNCNIEYYTYLDLHNLYGTGVRSIQRCLAKEKNFNTAYGQVWEKISMEEFKKLNIKLIPKEKKFAEKKPESGYFIKKIRKQKKLAQKEFAAKVGVTQSYISSVESNKMEITLTTFLSWMEKLDLTLKV